MSSRFVQYFFQVENGETGGGECPKFRRYRKREIEDRKRESERKKRERRREKRERLRERGESYRKGRELQKGERGRERFWKKEI